MYLFHGSSTPSKVSDRADVYSLDEASISIQWDEIKKLYRVLQYRDGASLHRHDPQTVLADLTRDVADVFIINCIEEILATKEKSEIILGLEKALEKEPLVREIFDTLENVLLSTQSHKQALPTNSEMLSMKTALITTVRGVVQAEKKRLEEAFILLTDALERAVSAGLEDETLRHVIEEAIQIELPSRPELLLLKNLLAISTALHVMPDDILLCLDGNLRAVAAPRLSLPFFQCVEVLSPGWLIIFSNTPECLEAAETYLDLDDPYSHGYKRASFFSVQVIATTQLKEAVSSMRGLMEQSFSSVTSYTTFDTTLHKSHTFLPEGLEPFPEDLPLSPPNEMQMIIETECCEKTVLPEPHSILQSMVQFLCCCPCLRKPAPVGDGLRDVSYKNYIDAVEREDASQLTL